MAITFGCACGRSITVKDEFAGKKGKCPSCGQIVEVPAPEEPKAPAPEVAAVDEEIEAASKPAAPSASTGETKACRSCRKQIARDAVFCVHCGTDLRTGRKHTQEKGGEDDYDIMKTAPDMVTKPMDAVGRIIEAPASPANLQKALILFVIGTAIFTFAVVRAGTQSPVWWMYLVAAVMAMVVTVVWGIVAGVTGATAGQTGIGFANVFMAILAARAVLGIALVVPLAIVLGMQNLEYAHYASIALRLAGGGALFYFVILRAHDCGQMPAIISAVAAAALEAIFFYVPSLIINNFVTTPVSLF